MSQASIRAAIYAIVDGVDGTGNVYDYRRWAVRYDSVLSMFKDSTAGTILGFVIGEAGANYERVSFRTTGDAGLLCTWTFPIVMYYGAKDADATMKTAETLIESVATALNSSSTLHDGQTFYHASPANISIFELRTFGNDLVHYGQIDQAVTEYMT